MERSSKEIFEDMAGKATATAQGLSGMFVSDEVVKATMASYTFEHMEIASYKSLIAAADLAGDTETKRVCEAIVPQKEAMAEWLRHIKALPRDPNTSVAKVAGDYGVSRTTQWAFGASFPEQCPDRQTTCGNPDHT